MPATSPTVCPVPSHKLRLAPAARTEAERLRQSPIPRLPRADRARAVSAALGQATEGTAQALGTAARPQGESLWRGSPATNVIVSALQVLRRPPTSHRTSAAPSPRQLMGAPSPGAPCAPSIR